MSAIKKDFYVYELIDPRTKKPFFVGRAFGVRLKDQYKDDSQFTSHTKLVIEDIKLAGKSPEISVISKDMTEEESIKFEAELIKKHGRITKDRGGILTNKFIKDKSKSNDTLEYATIQIRADVKNQVVDFCNRKGYKIGRFVENLFIQAVSGSGGAFSGSINR